MASLYPIFSRTRHLCFHYECFDSVSTVVVYTSDVAGMPTASGVKEEKWAGMGEKNNTPLLSVLLCCSLPWR